MLLETFQDSTIAAVSSEKGKGIQFYCKFPPSLAEVKEFCEDLQRRASYSSDYAARVKKQLDERDAYDAQVKTESLEHRKAVVARVKAELAQHGMHSLQDQDPKAREAGKTSIFRRFSAEDLRQIYAPPKQSTPE